MNASTSADMQAWVQIDGDRYPQWEPPDRRPKGRLEFCYRRSTAGLIVTILTILQCLIVLEALPLEDVLQNEAMYKHRSESELAPSSVRLMNSTSLAPDPDDTRVLLDIYFSTQGESWDSFCQWDISADATSWSGVAFDSTTMRVISLDFFFCSLAGTIPTSIGNLSSLSYLELGSNNLVGTIPVSIGNLVNLEYLSVYSNSLTGTIPSSIGQLQSLGYFAVSYNRLSGSIPPIFGDLVLLNGLLMGFNKLTGTIPSSIGNLVNLDTLHFFQNSLTGIIPPIIHQLQYLIYFDVSRNQLSGSIAPAIGDFVYLKELRLNENKFTGTIPPSIGQLQNLAHLDMNQNQLSGSLPLSVEDLIPSLLILNLRSNQLSGSLPIFTESSPLTNVIVSYNNFEGRIPSSLCSLSKINEVRMAGNKFTCFEGCLETVKEGYYDYMLHAYYPVCGNQQQAICDLANALDVGSALKDPFSIPAIQQSFPEWDTIQPMVNTFTFYELAIAEYEVSFGRDLSAIFGSVAEGVRVDINCTLCNSYSCSNYISDVYDDENIYTRFPGIYGYKPFVSDD